MKGFINTNLLVTSVLIAGTVCANFNGFYLGVNGGALQTQAEMEQNANGIFTLHQLGATFLPNLNNFSSLPTYDESAIFAAHLGYGYSFKNLPVYLGVELFGNGADRDTSNHLSSAFINPTPGSSVLSEFLNSSHNMEMNDWEYGADLKAGFKLATQTLLYGRVGAAFNELKLTSDYFFSGLDIIGNRASQNFVTAEEEDNVTGLRLGVGIEHNLSQHFSVTADYIYTDYGDIDTEITTNSVNPDGSIQPNGFIAHSEADVMSHAIMLGANYYFSGDEKSSYRNNIHLAKTYFDSVILGLRGGAIINNSNIDFKASVLDPQHSFDGNLYANGYMGSIFGGYGRIIGRTPFYLALEMFFSEIQDIEITAQESTVETLNITNITPNEFADFVLESTVESELGNEEFGFDLRPGILLAENILFYGRIGVAFNDVELESHNHWHAVMNTNNPPIVDEEFLTLDAQEDLDDANVTGLRLGAGLEYYLQNKFSVTADYIFTDYGSVEAENFETSPDILHPIFTTVEAEIKTQAFLLGVTYHHF